MDSTIDPEEYPFIAFGINWLIERVLSDRNAANLARPYRILIDETPDLNAAESDLIFWWHKAVIRYGESVQKARVNLLQKSKSDAKLDKLKLLEQGELDVNCDDIDDPKIWRFTVSRVGVDRSSCLALVHFFVQADGNCWLNYGYTLLLSWNEDGSIYLEESHVTVSPGK